MTCSHLSYKREATGSESECLNCHLPIIFDGKKWRWLYDISLPKTRALRKAYEIDRATGKHS